VPHQLLPIIGQPVLHNQRIVVLEETDESYFWLEFIIDEKLLKRELVEPLLKEADELTGEYFLSQSSIVNRQS
jgi:hypothetical protein